MLMLLFSAIIFWGDGGLQRSKKIVRSFYGYIQLNAILSYMTILKDSFALNKLMIELFLFYFE